MARNKKGRAAKAARYRSMTASRQQDQQQDFAAQLMPRAAAAHSFSLRDEAKNTAKHNTSWDQESKLRVRPVVFVSAGVIEPLKELNEPGPDLEPPSLDGAIEAPLKSSASPLEQDSRQTRDAPVTVAGPAASPGSEASRPLPPREDLPFFIDTAGDQKLSSGPHSQPVIIPDPHSSGSETDSSEEVVLFKGRNRRDEDPPPLVDQITVDVHAVEQNIRQISLQEPDEAGQSDPRPASPPAWQLRGHNDEDAIVADYMANMVAEEDEGGSGDEGSLAVYHALFGNRDLGGSDGDVVIADESDSVDSEAADQEHSDDDSPEMPETYESGEDGMDDETLARLMAKQEELGLSEDEYMLFSAVGHSGTRPGSASTALRQEKLSSKTGRKQGRGKIPSASAVADVFDDLDLMDWDRHNGHNKPRKPKSKRGLPIFDVSDSDLEATLQTAWQKDRLSKREKKKDREELRAQGLLGKHADPTDPRVKYQTGMTLDQIKEEMRAFLCASDDNLTFPPMDASARKVIHDIANKFNIKSKSAGHGETRRPTLYRTNRTIRYNETSFEQVFARTGRKYFPRLDAKGKAPREGGKTIRPGRGVSQAAFTYRDGEVVGASAPELDQKNKGRTMLEKMGWTTGTALGAMDNKGILQPVVHVVKRSKAGLG